MKSSIKVSTIWIFILTQTIISILFYIGDKFISAGEAITIFLVSLPITYFIQWLREVNEIKKDRE
jgi:hypothetical protein